MVNSVVQILGLIAAGVAGLAVLCFLFRRPEIAFALFIAAYVLKGGINVGILNLTAILLIISVLGFSLPVLLGKELKFRIRAADIWLWVFMAILIAGILWSSPLVAGLNKAFRILTITFFPYFLVRIFSKNTAQIKRFLVTLFLAASAVALLLVIQNPLVHGGRAQILEANPIPEASLLGMGFLVAIIGNLEGFFKDQKFLKWLSVGMLPFLVYGILLTRSRGPLVAVTIVMLFYLALALRRKPKIALGIGISAAIIVVVVLSSGVLPQAVVHRYNLSNWLMSTSVMQRKALYRNVWSDIEENPVIGMGTAYGLKENIFLEVAGSVGIVGLIPFLAFLFSAGRHAFRYYLQRLQHQNYIARAASLIVLGLALMAFIDKQVSYSLDGDKDLFIFLGLVMNLPITWRKYRKHTEGTE